MKYYTDIEKACLISNFEKRGWTRGSADDYNFYWSCISNFRAIFAPETGYRLTDSQIINHFGNNFELTKKDSMVKNLKRYRKELEKDKSISRMLPRYQYVDFIPLTYTLPGDYNLVAEEFRKSPNSVWIMKPTDKARGIGIFIINRLSQIKKWSRDGLKHQWSYATCKDTYIISNYISNPLLIGGKKFDLRLYVLVTGWKPLVAYRHSHGFGRFCQQKYNNDVGDLDNSFMHLTNVSIQKHGEDYNEINGGKWSYKNLIMYLNATRGAEATNEMLDKIDSILFHSLKSVQTLMSNDRHCFECYGYDIIIDENLRPWLIEVNASPSLSATTAGDRNMKHTLINDVINIVVPEDFPANAGNCKKKLGGFVPIPDSIIAPNAEVRSRPGSSRSVRKN